MNELKTTYILEDEEEKFELDNEIYNIGLVCDNSFRKKIEFEARNLLLTACSKRSLYFDGLPMAVSTNNVESLKRPRFEYLSKGGHCKYILIGKVDNEFLPEDEEFKIGDLIEEDIDFFIEDEEFVTDDWVLDEKETKSFLKLLEKPSKKIQYKELGHIDPLDSIITLELDLDDEKE